MHTSIPTNQERHACVPTSNCKDMHFFAMYISLLFCNVLYKECSGEGYHTRVPHCGPVLVPARGGGGVLHSSDLQGPQSGLP